MPKEMTYSLDASHDRFIRVNVSGEITKAKLVNAMSELMSHPQYTDKHSLWDLSNARLGLTIGDLKEITAILRLYRPEKDDFANHAAILVPGEMHRAVADLFIAMTKMLPFEYSAFNEINDAIAFLSSR